MVLGPDNLDLGPPRPHRKFRFVVKLFKDAKQLRDAEFLSRGRRPFPTIFAREAEGKVQSGVMGDTMSVTFMRTDVEDFNEIWLGLYDGVGTLIEEWDFGEVKIIPPGWPGYEECLDEGEQTVTFTYEKMMYRSSGGEWTNWSAL